MSLIFKQIKNRDIGILTALGYTRDYNPIVIDDRGRVNLDKTFNIHIRKLSAVSDAPANAPEKIVVFRTLFSDGVRSV